MLNLTVFVLCLIMRVAFRTKKHDTLIRKENWWRAQTLRYQQKLNAICVFWCIFYLSPSLSKYRICQKYIFYFLIFCTITYRKHCGNVKLQSSSEEDGIRFRRSRQLCDSTVLHPLRFREQDLLRRSQCVLVPIREISPGCHLYRWKQN